MVGGGHGVSLLSGLAAEIMGVVGGHEWLQVPGCSGWVVLIVGQALRLCQCDTLRQVGIHCR